MLTERLIRDTPPGGKDRILWDAQIKGLGVRIPPRAETYILNYRVSGREHRVTLARVGRWRSVRRASARAPSWFASVRARPTR